MGCDSVGGGDVKSTAEQCLQKGSLASWPEKIVITMMIIVIKRISRPPIYRTRWECRALYSNTNNTHTHRSDGEDIGTAV